MTRGLRALAVLSVAICLGPGCATGLDAPRAGEPPDQPEVRSWPEDSDAYREMLSLREAPGAAAPKVQVGVPEGIDATALAPLPADDPAASLAEIPLEQALEELRAQVPGPGPAPSEPPAEPTLLRARRLYASGVAKLLDGDAPGAARDLTAAAQLDPSSPAPWLRLAEAQAAQGQNPAAMLSYKRAADLGADSALPLAVVGMQAARSGQHAEAAHYLARALASQGAGREPLLRNVALVYLTGPLREHGYLRASIQAITDGLAFPDRLAAPTRFADETREIAQRASDLWRDVGDTACRLGDEQLAADAYAKAAKLPSFDPSAILARRVYVLLRSGRDAEAALLLLDDVAAHDGRADGRHLALLRILRDRERVGALTARALDDLQATLTRPLAESTASALSLARAAATSPREARAILLRRLAEAPHDEAAATALMRLADSEAERLRLALELVEQNPAGAGQTASLLFAWHPRPSGLPEQIPTTPAGRVLIDRCLHRLGRAAEALPPPGPIAPPRTPIESARVEGWGLAAASLGEWRTVDEAAASLEQAGEARALAVICRASQRYDDVLQALEPLLGADASLPTLLRASEAALATGDAARAEALLLRAQAIDPHDEGSYEGLITIYQARGDQQQTATTIRSLRERVPSGRVLRWVSAQELARRGMLDEAEQALKELIEDAPEQANALGLLLQIWQQRSRAGDDASLTDAHEWLRARAESPPYSADALAALARLLALQERWSEARQVLDAGMDARPSPVLARALEDLTRETGDAEHANDMALRRLESAGRGIDNSLELAELLVRLERVEEAMPHLADAAPPRATLTIPQQNRVFSLLLATASWAEQPGSPERRRTALEAISRMESLGVRLPWQVRYSGWTLLYRDPDAPTDQIIRTTQSFVEAVDSEDAARAIVNQVRTAPASRMGTLDEARAELAYTLGNLLDIAGRKDAALAAYRTALRFSPDHAWAANDLGYSLVERHEQTEEAERLLELAYRLEPDEPSIADSLGWLRYKLGQWEDRTLADGTTVPGAVSLLTHATALPEGDTRAVIHDHLGDALWRAGNRERAEAMWLRAQQLLIGELVSLRDSGASQRRAELTEIQTLVGDKLDAVRAGREPLLAPLIGED